MPTCANQTPSRDTISTPYVKYTLSWLSQIRYSRKGRHGSDWLQFSVITITTTTTNYAIIWIRTECPIKHTSAVIPGTPVMQTVDVIRSRCVGHSVGMLENAWSTECVSEELSTSYLIILQLWLLPGLLHSSSNMHPVSDTFATALILQNMRTGSALDITHAWVKQKLGIVLCRISKLTI